jgi:hypothetical protein
MKVVMFKITAIITTLFLFSGCINHDKTPEAAVKYFWESMAKGDKDEVLKTQVYYLDGMSSEFINTPQNIEWLYLDSVTTVYESQTRARVYYQVIFKKNDQAAPTRYKTGTMTIKKGKKWKVGIVVGKQK